MFVIKKEYVQMKPSFADQIGTIEETENFLKQVGKFVGKPVRFVFIGVINAEQPDLDRVKTSCGLAGEFKLSELVVLRDNIDNFITAAITEGYLELLKKRLNRNE